MAIPPSFLRLTSLGGMLTALLLLAACVGFESPGSGGPPADAPTYRVGDRWVYSGTNGFRSPVVWTETHEVTAIAPEGITFRITQKGPTLDNSRIEVLSAPGVVRAGAIFDDETRRFATPLRRYDFPMLPGKSWNQWVNNFNEATQKEGQINRYVRVGDWEKVTTPAGTFDAIKMRVFMRLDDEEFWRYATECNYLIYYSPAARGFVREEKEAQYREKGDPHDGQGAMRSQHALIELTEFTPGRS